jgi:homogentisate phytyltransferase/homogentisate geranylgeranyltransferase
MNVYITGLNQVTDVEIDKVNKPYLPMASGDLSTRRGILVVLASLIGSLYLVKDSLWPLQSVVIGSGILGTLYSMPPFRLKRFPLLAAFCILVVRGSLVNMGFFFQAKAILLASQKQHLPSSLWTACAMYPESVLLTTFFAIFGIVIALCKDIPDIEGDRQFNIASFSVQLGAAAMFRIAITLLSVLLSVSAGGAFAAAVAAVAGGAAGSAATTAATVATTAAKATISASTAATAAAGWTSSMLTVVGSRLALGTALAALAGDVRQRASVVDPSQPKVVFEYYMHVWKVFYGCYLLLPLVR